jgi:hypothetical protein
MLPALALIAGGVGAGVIDFGPTVEPKNGHSFNSYDDPEYYGFKPCYHPVTHKCPICVTCRCEGTTVNCQFGGYAGVKFVDLHSLGGISVNATVLNIQDNDIDELPFNMMQGLPNLLTLNAFNNRIAVLGNNTFEGAGSIKRIDLTNNMIKDIPQHLFANSSKLQTLSFRQNWVQELHKDTFKNLTDLRRLDFAANDIQGWGFPVRSLFADTGRLEKLELDNLPCLGGRKNSFDGHKKDADWMFMPLLPTFRDNSKGRMCMYKLIDDHFCGISASCPIYINYVKLKTRVTYPTCDCPGLPSCTPPAEKPFPVVLVAVLATFVVIASSFVIAAFSGWWFPVEFQRLDKKPVNHDDHPH